MNHVKPADDGGFDVIPLRTDYDAASVRSLARKASDADQVRRLLAIAAVYDGMRRAEAAAVGGMDRQSLCNWVHRFNADGPEGLHDRKPPGAVAKLTAGEKATLTALVEAGPDQIDGVVRWRRIDLDPRPAGWTITSARSRACCTISGFRT